MYHVAADTFAINLSNGMPKLWISRISFIVVSISKRIMISGNDDDDPDVSHSLLDNNNETLTKHVESVLLSFSANDIRD